MSVIVYPRLGQLLRERHLTVAELERQIEERFGLSVNPKTLYRLTQTTPVQRADLEIAGATAAILDVDLGDLFAVEAVPTAPGDAADARLFGPEDNRRMAALLDWQEHYPLSEAEWTELERLVATYGQLLHERRLRELAAKRGVPIAQVRRETEEQLDRAREWWRAFEADPDKERLIAEQAAQLRARWAE